MDWHSLERLEFDRVIAAIAERAESDGARERLRAWRPLASRSVLERETARLAEALHRQREPGVWCAVGRAPLADLLDPRAGDALDGPALVEVLGWLEACRETRAAWTPTETRTRHPRLADRVDALADIEPLRAALAAALEPDGRVRDSASPELARARREVATGERQLHGQLERWASSFGETAYVTRHADRYVALVPAAGFSRKRGIVHDVSGSGQSLFVEPLEMCEANNRLIEWRATASEEERRVLRALATTVRGDRDAVLAVEAGLVELDTVRARARWGGEFGGRALLPDGDRLRLEGARHPLLAMGERREALVPLDLELGADRLLLVSGPNMGGKTVLMKTLGLAVALAHSGLPVLAGEGSLLPSIEDLRVAMGDEQSVDQGLSTFAAHLRALAAMAAAAGPRTLVLVDELGAGTDPEEGAALGRALLEHLAAARTWGVVTTHLGSLKRVAGEVAGIVNGSLEFDLETLSPRYRFVPGVPGASYALAVAGRLGFPPAILARAGVLVPDEARALERLLAELADVRRDTHEKGVTLAEARQRAEHAEEQHRMATDEARRQLADLRRRLTSESEALLVRARELWQLIQREAKRADKSRAGAAELKERMNALDQDAQRLQESTHAPVFGLEEVPAPAAPLALAAGVRVRVLDLGVDAEVVSGPDPEGRVTLRRGAWNIQSHANKLAPLASPAPAAATTRQGPAATFDPGDAPPTLEVDLRGMELDEALRAVDRGLDRAVLTGLSELRIIHGIGRGVLKVGVERHLRGHPQVESSRLGEVREGGRGVSVARLR